MSDYRRLKVWQRTMDFVTRAYEVTSSFPPHELYGLTSQIRRAATSIALNIAEGATSGYDSEYKSNNKILRSAQNDGAKRRQFDCRS